MEETIMTLFKTISLSIAVVFVSVASSAQAGEPTEKDFVTWSGFEGQEQMLGAAVAETIMDVTPVGFTSGQQFGT